MEHLYDDLDDDSDSENKSPEVPIKKLKKSVKNDNNHPVNKMLPDRHINNNDPRNKMKNSQPASPSPSSSHKLEIFNLTTENNMLKNKLQLIQQELELTKKPIIR